MRLFRGRDSWNKDKASMIYFMQLRQIPGCTLGPEPDEDAADVKPPFR